MTVDYAKHEYMNMYEVCLISPFESGQTYLIFQAIDMWLPLSSKNGVHDVPRGDVHIVLKVCRAGS